MASRRYSQADQQKMVQDKLADFRAKGIDAQAIHSLHPGGVQETLKHLSQNTSAVRDQSQSQTEANRADIKRKRKNA